MELTPQIPLSQVEIYGALRYSVEQLSVLFGVTPAYIADLMADPDSEFSQAYDTGRKKANDETLESIRKIEQGIRIDDLKKELFGL